MGEALAINSLRAISALASPSAMMMCFKRGRSSVGTRPRSASVVTTTVAPLSSRMNPASSDLSAGFTQTAMAPIFWMPKYTAHKRRDVWQVNGNAIPA